MGATWVEWTRFALIPLLAVLITAIVSTRNSKKTPHERLKNLVEIQEKIPEELDTKGVVRAAISRELVDFDRRMAADQRGIWSGLKERIAQWGALAVSGLAVPLVVGVIIALAYTDVPEVLLALLATFSAGLFTTIGATVSTREARRTLRLDRAAAIVLSAFPRVRIQELALNGSTSIARTDFLFGVAEHLEALGVLEKSSAASEVDTIVFVATPFGKTVLDQSLREADRQHIDKWESIARENAGSNEQSGPGR